MAAIGYFRKRLPPHYHVACVELRHDVPLCGAKNLNRNLAVAFLSCIPAAPHRKAWREYFIRTLAFLRLVVVYGKNCVKNCPCRSSLNG